MNNNCNLTTCRYNQDGKCTNEDKQKECVEVSRKVLCLRIRIMASSGMIFENINIKQFNTEIKCDKTEDCLIIGYDKSHDKRDKTVLTVGRKENDGLNIIAWFENEKAEKIYKILIGEVKIE